MPVGKTERIEATGLEEEEQTSVLNSIFVILSKYTVIYLSFLICEKGKVCCAPFLSAYAL